MAMAPSKRQHPQPEVGGRIGIRRHFTRPGVHPYDQVAWERRDSRITNYRDGTVAFEQRDVEVPVGWSLNATNILAQKYFRGIPGTPERETSLRQVADRVVDTIAGWGVKDGYFADDEEASAFAEELKYLIVTQRAAFNSPVWFNIGARGRKQQASACFILSVDDTMDSILNWYVEEGTIFKGGSGAGVNLSRIRSSKEHLRGGGTASGPVSFMRGADASAGTIKSGGATRRAAKMVILDVEHPDIEDFITCKVIEERKARVLREAGFDMDLDGKDSHSTQYQNANNSVRVTDEFMQAVLDDGDWQLRAVTTGEVLETVRARHLMRRISEATWECADPGMQFDTTINRWNTAAATGRINGSNPCFPGSARVHTDKGMVPFEDLVDRVRSGESFGVYTHDATNPDAPAQRLEITSPEAFLITGLNEIVKLGFDNGMELRCTPGHRIFTTNRGYVAATELTDRDEVKVLDLPAPAVHADATLAVSTDVADSVTKGDRSRSLRLPEKWSPELGHYLGWLVGDGCLAGDVVTTVYGGGDDQEHVLARHLELLARINGGRAPKPSVQANGTHQLRQSRRVVARFFEAMGISHAKAPDKRVPWSVEQAPPEAVAAFLRGLFDADGCVYDGAHSRYVGLGSASKGLLQDVQRLLCTFGVFSRIYHTQKVDKHVFSHVRKDGTEATYTSRPMYDLRIANRSIAAFADGVGFSVPAKAAKLQRLLDAHVANRCRETVRLVERVDDGVELTYNLTEPRNHSFIVDCIIIRNCSEYMHLDNSACNLASINLLAFLDEGSDRFDVAGYQHAVEVVFTAQEILVGNADYPTEPIAETSRRFRQLGLGYANLGALLMALGLPYDSDQGRAWAGALTAVLTGHAYATSARTAARMGAFAGFTENREHMLRVLGMHRDELAKVDEGLVPSELLDAARADWDDAVAWGEAFGVRNSQASVLAPTGCLVGGSLVTTERGLVRLRSLGDPDGPQWQRLGIEVATDEGDQEATHYYVNGAEPVVDVMTTRGYRIKGTTTHRLKVVDQTGAWAWRRLSELRPGDRVPLVLGKLVGAPQHVALPPLPEASWAGEHRARAPRQMSVELAELVGYFMGDGSLHPRGLRLCVADTDLDVVDRLRVLGKELFGLEADVAPRQGYHEVAFHSVRLVAWWEACGFAKQEPKVGHTGKGWASHVPDAVLHSNDRDVYAAFIRGLFEAGGSVGNGYPSWTTTSREFSHEVQTLLLALGFPTTRRFLTSGQGSPLAVLRLVNLSLARRWTEQIGFLGNRKNALVWSRANPQAARHDHIPVTRELVDRLAPDNGRLRRVLLLELAGARVSRRIATELYERTRDAELGHLLGFFYDTVASATLGDDELTYDLSVPANVTYVANGFVSHNTIGLLMDCDTTGVEPDLGLCKMKKLVGGGTMTIVNQTVPRALRRLGYTGAQIDAIVAYVDEHKTILGAPHLAAEHAPVFACSMGDNAIHYDGHIRMMGAVQPFISGAISKTVNMPEDVSVEDVEQLHLDAWRLGIKAVAIYRDNCKVAQPLSMAKKEIKPEELTAVLEAAVEAAPPQVIERIVEKVVMHPVRQKLPRNRRSRTFEFRVADCKGFVTVGEYDDGRPGELFLRVSKQGSTLAGIMDAFAISVSHGLQYGVPLKAFIEAFTNMRFEPAGMTDDADIRFASSLVDYIFRRLAVDYLPLEDRMELGILSVGERHSPTLPGIEEAVTETTSGLDLIPSPPAEPTTAADLSPFVQTAPSTTSAAARSVRPGNRDAPYCMQCGVQMIRSGSCHACPSCGSTSGCS